MRPQLHVLAYLSPRQQGFEARNSNFDFFGCGIQLTIFQKSCTPKPVNGLEYSLWLENLSNFTHACECRRNVRSIVNEAKSNEISAYPTSVGTKCDGAVPNFNFYLLWDREVDIRRR